jgi:hypothetical protein
MKKLLMGAAVLLCFAVALTLTQVSCSKSTAQTTGTSSPVGLVLYEGDNAGNPNTVNFYLCNYDGSNAHQIQITGLPTGFVIQDGGKLSPDGKKLFFVAANTAQPIPGNAYLYQCYLYTVGVDGSNLKQLTALPTNSSYDATVAGAY